MDEEDQREAISRTLPDNERGRTISSDDDGEDADRRESISRRLPDEGEQPTPAGEPQQLSPDTAGGVTKSVKKKVKWNSDIEKFESQAAWGGARSDMAVVRQ